MREEKTYKELLEDILILHTLINPNNDPMDNEVIRDMIMESLDLALEKIREQNGVGI